MKWHFILWRFVSKCHIYATNQQIHIYKMYLSHINTLQHISVSSVTNARASHNNTNNTQASFMFLWPCIMSKAWRRNTNEMQQYRWFIVNCRWVEQQPSQCSHPTATFTVLTPYSNLHSAHTLQQSSHPTATFTVLTPYINLHSAHTLQRSTTELQPATSNTTSKIPHMQ